MCKFPLVFHCNYTSLCIIIIILLSNIHKLQCVQNSSSRVVLSGNHREHLSASMWLSNLHWLPVRKHIDFKFALTPYKILSTHQPAYMRSLLFPYEPTRAMRSSSQQLLNVTTDFGRRAFSYCAPKIWNEIPATIRNAANFQTPAQSTPV